jgi:hypothetical protein
VGRKGTEQTSFRLRGEDHIVFDLLGMYRNIEINKIRFRRETSPLMCMCGRRCMESVEPTAQTAIGYDSVAGAIQVDKLALRS